jgi:glycosyltransferase involved in cell wall biosynthesis
MNKISIITINYNDAEGLGKTLTSVAAQTYTNIEHIIIDGGSTDSSVEVIREYEQSLISSPSPFASRLKWISEPDKGIYDAMNKGVAKSSGEYLLFLNGGDALASPTAIEDVIPYLNDTDFVIGRSYFSNEGKQCGASPLLSEKDMSMYYMYLHGINHQSAFIRRNLLIDTPYDTNVRISADWLFFVQTIVMQSATVKFVDLFFSDFDLTGVSSNNAVVLKEREEVLKKLLPERIARDYIQIAPHYYEVIRLQWLLNHPICYKIYRSFTTLCRKVLGK